MRFDEKERYVMFSDLDQDSDSWLEWRQQGLGSSDIALIMSPERQFDRDLITLWRDRTGIEPHPFVENEHTKRGKELEPQIRDAVNSMLGSSYVPECMYRADAPYLRASLDGFEQSTNSILEIKSPSDKVFQKYLEDWTVPENYMYQMQYQMLVSSADYGWFAFFNDTVNHPKLIYVAPNLEMQSEIERRSHLVWQAIKTKTPIGFVDGQLTLMPVRPTVFLCFGGAVPDIPVEKRTGMTAGNHSFYVSIKDFRSIPKILELHPDHEVKVISKGGTPFDRG